MHKQAALNTLKVIALSIIAGAAVVLGIQLLTFDVAITFIGIGFLVYFIYMFYNIEKGRLESQERFNNMSK